MTQVYIYTLENPITKEIRYIGKTTQLLNKRLKAHIYESKQKNNHKCNWILMLLKKNIKPDIKLIDIVLEENWEFWESYWIEQFKVWGFNLVNQTPGGEGYKHTEETKQKIREAQLGSNGHMYGKKMSKEVRKKISNSLQGNTFRKGKKSSPETIQKNKINASRYWLGKKRDKKSMQKMSRTKSKQLNQFDLNDNFIKTHYCVKEACEDTGAERTTLYDCLNGKFKQCRGFKWKWAD